MIGKLKGTVDAIGPDYILLDVQGLCYDVYLSSREIKQLSLQQQVSLWISQIVKEDGSLLYGFFSLLSKAWFRELIKLNGISGRTAINILGQLSIKDLEDGIYNQDATFFASVSGIGNKTASRMVLELSNAPKKVLQFVASHQVEQSDTDDFASIYEPQGSKSKAVGSSSNGNYLGQMVDALCSLGYHRNKALDASQKALRIIHETEEDYDLAKLIKTALQEIR